MKRFMAILLCLAMVLSLAACGNGSASTPETSAADNAQSAAAPANDAAPAENDAEPEPAEEESTGPKIFSYGTDANSTTFDPASDLQTNSGSFLVHAVGETLWTVDAEGNVTYKLAESHLPSRTVHLR